MSSEKKDCNWGDLEKCLEEMFLDPYTSVLDHTQFRIDVFETGEEIIIEAQFHDDAMEEIILARKEHELTVEAVWKDLSVRKRTIQFPFSLQYIPMEYFFMDDRVEIKMKKTLASSAQPPYYRIQTQ
ncbi:hypothetical protein [Falsibacillus pallidus]|uniref:HSP20 family protein n=1 Tax=Falsibacillus pallidus TaxID=493781 RepID=A0A370GQ76_9BACI|nr:hypothetical protein [Falsibacillus pallidus]RDI45827.1 HSP20 family protein [Falsibacillus pallidus]